MSRRRGDGKETPLDKALAAAGGARIGEAARRLGVGREVVHRYMEAGKIKTVLVDHAGQRFHAVDEQALRDLEARMRSAGAAGTGVTAEQ